MWPLLGLMHMHMSEPEEDCWFPGAPGDEVDGHPGHPGHHYYYHHQRLESPIMLYQTGIVVLLFCVAFLGEVVAAPTIVVAFVSFDRLGKESGPLDKQVTTYHTSCPYVGNQILYDIVR